MTASVVIIHNCEPSSTGHGGNHRSYQILHDAQALVGQGSVRSIMAMPWWEDNPIQPKSTFPLLRQIEKVRRRLVSYSENPYKVLALTGLATKGTLHPKFVSHYRNLVRALPRPIVCIIENAAYAPIVDMNRDERIPTVICPINLEGLHGNLRFLMPALDAYASGSAGRGESFQISASMLDLGNELRVLARCTERLLISRVETGVVGGVGIRAQHYPYLPVGEVRRRLCAIREKRREGVQERGLFLMVGNAIHLPTGRSLEWFIENARLHGIPTGIRIVVVGGGVEQMLPPGVTVPGLELRGWVKDEELDELLIQAQAALLPQQYGLGAVTRLPEYGCAGVPVIALPHASFAYTPLPNVQIVDLCWDDWRHAMESTSGTQSSVYGTEYDDWERRQPTTLKDVLQRLLRLS
jgi:hypothetical protein